MNEDTEYSTTIGIGPTNVADVFKVQGQESQEVLRITNTGEIYWKQRLVETDEDFKSAMLDLVENLKKMVSVI